MLGSNYLLQGGYFDGFILEENNICTHMGDDYDRFNRSGGSAYFMKIHCLFSPKFKELPNALSKESEEYVYTRGTNPTVEILEKKLAALEHGEACKVFSSGMAAISSTMVSFFKAGRSLYYLLIVFMGQHFNMQNISKSSV